VATQKTELIVHSLSTEGVEALLGSRSHR